ncbi:MAG: NYN domain-containing protein [bacterium]
MGTYAFIDSQNVNLAIRDAGWILDFLKLRMYLAKKYGVTKAFLFIGYVPKYRNLYQFLRQAGYTIVFKPTVLLGKDKAKGNVDAELVLHAMIEYLNYKRAIIISGDGDFYCLVDYLRQQNKLLRLIIPNRYKYSSLFRRHNFDLVYLTDLRIILEKQKREALPQDQAFG